MSSSFLKEKFFINYIIRYIPFQAQKTLPKREGRKNELPFTLTRGLRLFLALDAGLFVMLALADLLKDTAACALPLKPFERAFQGLIFTDTNLRHFLSLLSLKEATFWLYRTIPVKPQCYYSRIWYGRQSFFYQTIPSESCLPPSI